MSQYHKITTVFDRDPGAGGEAMTDKRSPIVKALDGWMNNGPGAQLLIKYVPPHSQGPIKDTMLRKAFEAGWRARDEQRRCRKCHWMGAEPAECDCQFGCDRCEGCRTLCPQCGSWEID